MLGLHMLHLRKLALTTYSLEDKEILAFSLPKCCITPTDHCALQQKP
jgi:hypothetical protein